jgi:Tfp pilus assembly protein PilF
MAATVLILDFGWASASGLDLKAAKTALKAKEYQAAVDIISPNLEAAPREAFLVLASAYTEMTNHTMALKTLNAGSAKFKGDREIMTEIGRTNLALNQEREAKAILKDVIELFPKYEPAYLVMGEIYEKKKNRYELRMLYQDLVEKVGEKGPYLTKLCDLATRDGHYELSFRFCEKALAKNPKEPLNYVNIATAAKETGNSERAQQFYKKAADTFGKSELALVSYAKYLDESKNQVESFTYWKRATVAEPASAPAWTGLAFSALEIQKFAEVMAAFEKLCEVDKDAERQLRRAAAQLKSMKQETWLEKLKEMIGKCDEKNRSRKFL